MKKIYINGRFLTQKITGVQRVAHETLKALDNIIDKYKDDIRIIVIIPKGSIRNYSFKNIEIKNINFLSGHLWEQITLPFITRNKLLLNFCNTAPLFKRKQIVVIHDAAIRTAPEGFNKRFIYWYRVIYWWVSKLAHRIVTVSNFSKSELIQYYPSMKGKIVTVYNGSDHITKINKDDEILEKYNLKKGKYILAVSSVNPNKNFDIIPKALASLKGFDSQLIIVGGRQEKVFSTGKQSPKDVKGIIWTGFVTDAELVSLYQNASLFIFPSRYEGFGLPPLEAMALGCSVLSSNAASMPEILKNNAIYFNPNDEKGLAKQLKKLLSNPEILKKNESSLKNYSQKYTWDKTAKEILNLIQHID